MSSVLELPDLRGGYVELVDHVIRNGKPKAPRGQPTRELRDVTLVVADPGDVLPVGVGRRLNTRIALLEAVQLIAGRPAPVEMINRVAPHMATFAWADDFGYWGNYGKRIGTQLLQVERKLREDPDTRQAVATLWDPSLDNQIGPRDFPCTIALEFAIDDGKLLLGTKMRSNDVWLGLAQDAAQFCQLQLTLAAALGLEVGPYRHNAWSLHIYERDLPATEELYLPDPLLTPFRFGEGIGLPGQPMSERMTRANAIIDGRPIQQPTPVERAYQDALA